MVSYETWTREELIAHIHNLEADSQPRGRDTAGDHALVAGTRSEPKVKKARTYAARPFDFSRYQQRYVAFKFAYLGWHYNGLVTQDMPTELPTVEEELFKAMLKTKLIDHPDRCRFSRCGRTDKGVSAMGQVMALNVRSSALVGAPAATRETELPWMEQLNSCLPPTIRILAYDDAIDASFDARFSCVKRHYKYLLAPRIAGAQQLNLEAMNQACTHFLGDHDFRNFCKLDASKQISNFTRTILRCRVSPITSNTTMPSSLDEQQQSPLLSNEPLGLYVLDLEGTAFLWHQVRCITAILLLIGQGKESPDLVRDLLDVSATPTKPIYEMADDWPLTLYECDFGTQVSWQYSRSSARLLESTFATLHEARIKDAVTSFMVNAVSAGVTQEVMRPGINLGDGKVKVQAKYVPVMQRPRMNDVRDLNAAYLEKKERKTAERQGLGKDRQMVDA